jgi:hypothetical protein
VLFLEQMIVMFEGWNMSKVINVFLLVCVVGLVTGCGSTGRVAKSSELPILFESVVEFSVDGQPITLTKRYRCHVNQFSKAGGDKFVEVTRGEGSVSHVLPSGEVVVVALPYACNRFGVAARDEAGKPTGYRIAHPLPKGFMPAMLMGDKSPVPDEISLYASEHAYNAPASRIAFKGISLTVAKTGTKSTPDPYGWMFKKGYEGPAYVGWAARKAIKIDGMDELFDKHIPQREGVVRLDINDPDDFWFQRYYNGWGNRKYILPKSMGQTVRTYINGRDVRASHYGGHYIGFTLQDGQSLHDEQITVRYRPEQHGIMQLYRAPLSKYRNGHHSVSWRLPVTYVFDSKERFIREPKIESLLMYDAKGRELYQAIPLSLRTGELKGRGLGKYNLPPKKK